MLVQRSWCGGMVPGVLWSWSAGLLIALAGCMGTIGGSPGAPDDRDQAPRADLPGVERAEPEQPGFAPVSPLVRRLTREEYLHTVEDVLGVRLSDEQAAALPVDRPLDGFVNTASGQTVSPEHVWAYGTLAETVVESMDVGTFVADYARCTDATGECAASFVRSAGAELFRRPLDAREEADFTSLFEGVLVEGVSFGVAAGAVLSAMLQSPQFLYLLERERVEGGEGLRVVGGYEMASRLSYLLWASAPDDELYAAAEAGELDRPEGVVEQAMRLLSDGEKVRRVLRRFVVDWAGLASLPDDDGLKSELTDAAVATYVRHMEEGRTLGGLFTTQTLMLTPTLAGGYGVDVQGGGLEAYDLTGVAGRVGLLTHPGVVAGMTNADGGEIVARGLFLQRQVFCGAPPDPPAALQDEIDAFVAEQPPDASDRDIAEARLERAECAACHAQFDPLAYGFERFDFRGRYQTTDEHGNELRTAGWIPETLSGGERVPYGGIDDYMAMLAESPRAKRCMTQRHLEYALGSTLDAVHRAVIEQIMQEAEGAGGGYPALVRALVSHDLFRLMPVE